LHPLVAALLVSLSATAASYLLPEEHSSSAVALIFLVGTYFFCLRVSSPLAPPHYGLALGGLLEEKRLQVACLLAETSRALLIATAVAALVLPPFWWGFVEWYGPTETFEWSRALSVDGSYSPTKWITDMVLWHLVAVALPEEAFFRGYLQTALGDRWRERFSSPSASLAVSILVVSIVFAVGHLATDFHPARLAVFFPSLLFGLVRARSGGIGAAVFLHAECNIFSQLLGQGYGLY
jgi:membrane protease YdiL (CAAX protease family)